MLIRSLFAGWKRPPTNFVGHFYDDTWYTSEEERQAKHSAIKAQQKIEYEKAMQAYHEEQDPKHEAFQEKLGYYFKNEEIPQDASHLETLGDGVLKMFVMAALSQKHPQGSAADLTWASQTYLQNRSDSDDAGSIMYQIAKGLGLSGAASVKPYKAWAREQNCRADHLEMLIGAIYIDAGYDSRLVFKVLNNLFAPHGLHLALPEQFDTEANLADGCAGASGTDESPASAQYAELLGPGGVAAGTGAVPDEGEAPRV